MNWQDAIETTVSGLGYELVDVERSVGGMLRVYIDHPAAEERPERSDPRAITIEDCEQVTRQLQHVLEVEAVAYERLEVSSPGLDRPLKKAADYHRFSGEQVELTLKAPFQGRKRYLGELQPNGDGWRLLLEPGGGADATHRALEFTVDEVREARLVPVIDFKGRRFAPAAQPGAEAQGANEVDGGRIQ